MWRAICAIGLCALLGGCGPSVWERSFAYEPGEGPLAADAPGLAPAEVLVREVPWERVAAALEAEREAFIASDVHRDEWSRDEARGVEMELLRALQLPIPAGEATLIGRSRFTTTDTLDPQGPELRQFAAEVGAANAVWSSQWLGKAETIEHAPVERERWYWDRIWDADRGQHVYIRRWDRETDWVPVVIERDEVQYVVFYVRGS